ncbi:Flp pilus assembly complex ATPase component TadA (plasmid) [Burkholderia vietnamiensis]|uniref:Type II secretion system protein E n=1 Tax=Burkholderia vietnamiensis (strain G4 / LMG 22486) TaxID=269482 RepID=A4JTN2_BURVG|nr:type II secretion system protein E [Burkholderia vietnamiensis G4]MCB4350205.1 Flp pilus assembly complex ATPase component TadA [Burkholderia vietnamiensis]
MKEPDLFFPTGSHDRAAADYLNGMFLRAAQRRAADVHMLFESDTTLVQYGISGGLVEVDRVSNSLAKQLDDKLRARANIAASDRHTALDGRLRLKFEDRIVDGRVSIVPTISGQKIVVRLTDNSESVSTLAEIEMTPMVRQCLLDILMEPNGIFLVCGPTGSGKSTTLYAAIMELHDGTRNIYTLENPVEKIIPGITQVPINQHMTFAGGLRAGLRQAPNVMLVGEIRDLETAMIAIQAANTGHLVLATVHANNSGMAVTRLLDMGLDPKTIADALRGVLSQRLVDKLTPNPERLMREATEAEMHWMENAGIHHAGLRFPANVTEEDYAGRMPVMEIFRADGRVREAILSRGGEIDVFNAAMRQVQFETMAQASTRLAAAGFTTLERAMKLDRDEPPVPEIKRLGQVLVDLGCATPEQTFAAAEQQVELRKRGKVRRIGQILIETGVCTAQQVIEAIGFTEGAPEMIRYFVLNGRVSQSLSIEVEARWRHERAGQSLFHLYFELNHLTQDDFNDPSLIQFFGRRVARTARPYNGSGSNAAGVNAVAATV